MQYSTNYNMNKPELNDQYRLSHWNENTDIIDTELKKRENDDTALKNPTYTVPASDDNLVNGEGFQTAFGKIAKAISSFITHKGETTSVHGSTSNVVASKIIERDANARAKIQDAESIRDIASYRQVLYEPIYARYIGAKVVASSDITLYGEQIVDGYNCVVGDVVLAINQTTATENGVYIVQTGAWTRYPDYNTPSLINRAYICILYGTQAMRVYKAEVDSYTEGTTILTYRSGSMMMLGGDSSKRFFRMKIGACEEYRPPIGIPILWFGAKPSWALDFGNGASTKYLWATYPELNTTQFKSILDKFKTTGGSGLCADYDTSGFYVPDLRGAVIKAYGTNGKGYGHDAISATGGTLTERLPNGGFDFAAIAPNQSDGGNPLYYNMTFTRTSFKTPTTTPGSTNRWWSEGRYFGKLSLMNDLFKDNAHITPFSIGAMWIVRFY